MEIQSLQQYLSIIEKLNTNYTYTTGINLLAQTHRPHFIYRGHEDHKYELVPRIFRWKKLSESHQVSMYSRLEFNILSDFISEACRFIKDVHVDDITAWLEIAQHFGVPTRLLDFTENPLVALYFACIGSPEKDACVWVINEPEYNKKFFGEQGLVPTTRSHQYVLKIICDEIVYQYSTQHLDNMYFIQYPWIYKPHYREERMHLQESIFMLWGVNQGPLTGMIRAENYMSSEKPDSSEGGIICSILIPAGKKKELLNALDMCGINEKHIYPGLDGIGKYINNKYSFKQHYIT